MNSIRGYSLIEAILASFLLIGAFFIVNRLFHTGLQYSSKVEGRIVAVQVAERQMALVRRWARFQDDWDNFPSDSQVEVPGYEISVSIEDQVLFSPSSQLESVYQGDPRGRRAIRESVRLAVVEVLWGTDNTYRLVSLVSRDCKRWRPPPTVDISGVVPTVVVGTDPVNFSAQGFDEDGDPIPDLFFHWTVEPVYFNSSPVTGRILYDRRDGRTVSYVNQVQRRDGEWVTQNGECRVRAYARYNGILGGGNSEPFRVSE